MTTLRRGQSGHADGKLVGIILLSLLFLVAGSAAIWLYINYVEVKTDVDGKVTAAVAEAKKDQADADLAKFNESEKKPLLTFAGLDDYGHVTFDYPKIWSAYQSTNVSAGNGATYAVFFSPRAIPPLPSNALNDVVAPKKIQPSTSDVARYALRMKVEQKSYDASLASYDALIKNNMLKSSAFSNENGISGTRFDGLFNSDIQGSAVVIRMRDRTLTLRTDSDSFKKDFDALIKTIKFNE